MQVFDDPKFIKEESNLRKPIIPFWHLSIMKQFIFSGMISISKILKNSKKLKLCQLGVVSIYEYILYIYIYILYIYIIYHFNRIIIIKASKMKKLISIKFSWKHFDNYLFCSDIKILSYLY